MFKTTSAVFQLYCDVNKLYKLISIATGPLEIKHCSV